MKFLFVLLLTPLLSFASLMDDYNQADFSSHNIEALNQLRLRLDSAGRQAGNGEMIRAAIRIQNFIKIDSQLGKCNLNAEEIARLRDQVAIASLGSVSCAQIQEYLGSSPPGFEELTNLANDLGEVRDEILEDEAELMQDEIIKANRRKSVQSLAGINYRFGELDDISAMEDHLDKICRGRVCDEAERAELAELYSQTIADLIQQNAVRMPAEETSTLLNRQYIQPLQHAKSDLQEALNSARLSREDWENFSETRSDQEIQAELSYLTPSDPEYAGLVEELNDNLKYQGIRDAYSNYIQKYDAMMLSPAGALIPSLVTRGVGAPIQLPGGITRRGRGSRANGTSISYVFENDHEEIDSGDVTKAYKNARDRLYDHAYDMEKETRAETSMGCVMDQSNMGIAPSGPQSSILCENDPMANIAKWTLTQPDIVGESLINRPEVSAMMCSKIATALRDRETSREIREFLGRAGRVMDVMSLGLMLVPGVGVAARAAWVAGRSLGSKMVTEGGKRAVLGGLQAGGAAAAAGSAMNMSANAMELAELRAQEARMLAMSGVNAEFTKEQLAAIHRTISELRSEGIMIGFEVALAALATPASLERLSSLYRRLKNDPELKAKYNQLQAESEGSGDMFLAQLADGDVDPRNVNMASVTNDRVRSVQGQINRTCR